MEEVRKSKEWRFWPVIILATIYPINAVLVALAIPLYFFQAGVSVEIIGLLAAALAITYSFSPILFSRLSDKLGRKKSIIIAMVGTSIVQLTYLITLEPLPFFIARFFEGLVIGLYWANLQACISETNSGDHNKYIARFNLSWNAGCLFGFMFGAFVLFAFNDLEIVFKLSPFLAIIAACVAIFFFQEPIKGDATNKVNISSGNELKNSGLSNLHYPVLIPVLIIIVYGLGKASVNLLYPIKSEMLGFDSFTVYIILCIGLVAQITSMLSANLLTGKNVVRIPLVCIGFLIITMFLFGINSSFELFFVLYIALGLFTGILYGISLRLFLNLNAQRGTSRYSGLNESIIGFSFLLGPILAGQIARVDINIGFNVFAITFMGFLIAILILMKKIKQVEEG